MHPTPNPPIVEIHTISQRKHQKKSLVSHISKIRNIAHAWYDVVRSDSNLYTRPHRNPIESSHHIYIPRPTAWPIKEASNQSINRKSFIVVLISSKQSNQIAQRSISKDQIINPPQHSPHQQLVVSPAKEEPGFWWPRWRTRWWRGRWIGWWWWWRLRRFVLPFWRFRVATKVEEFKKGEERGWGRACVEERERAVRDGLDIFVDRIRSEGWCWWIRCVDGL